MRRALVASMVSMLILLGCPSGIFSYDECVAPPFISVDAPPVVMLVMERDHKLYYEAYNDATDLDEDGKLDVGYKDSIDYFGLFDSDKCYTYSTIGTPKFVPSRFAPNAHATTKDHYCGNSGEWSGNFLNWLSMSRMDVIKRVLYGGHRSADNIDETVLEGVYIPQDAHSWGKEYTGSDAPLLTPFAAPASNTRHLFCVTSNSANDPHVIKVALNDTHRMWEWASRERPVCAGPSSTASGDVVGSRSDITRYYVRAQACSLSPEYDTTFCKLYPGGGTTYKPVGLLQKYAEGSGSKVCSKSWKTCNGDNDCRSGEGLCVENTGMYLGLITGSYTKNISGGVLRKNIWSILDEINYLSGSFQTSENVQGNIILTLDRMKTIGFRYSDWSYQDSSGGTCGWITNHALQEGECRMWGNPVGEMMYEALRYLAGKGSPSSAYTYSTTADSTVSLPKPAWGISRGSKTYQTYDIYPSCARPFLLVISDENVSYDSNQLPGNSFGTSFTTDLTNLNVTTLANTIGTEESVAGSKFIGQSGNTSDFTCTSKSITNLGNIRGLCPEEPTKQGSFYAAAVAYYGHTMFQDNTGKPDVSTMAVTLASPVPDINVKVGNNNVRIVPAGKTVSGSYTSNVKTGCFDKCTGSTSDANGFHLGNCSSDAFCPTNQIVDFYVENITYDNATNLMTSATFRVNFEDVEQGADHDMDAIVKYTIQPIGGNQLQVSLDSSVYAAGGYDQVLGFVISGTSEDGAYYVVKDDDVSGTDSDTPAAVANLPKTWTKTFTVTGNAAGVLHDPLWYAAKWGGFIDTDGSKKPDRTKKWDKDGDGVPDNYFFVANPLKLYEQMEKAFIAILSRGGSAGAVATVTQEVQGQDMLVRGAFTSYEDDPREFVWKGHLEVYWPYEGCNEYTNQTDCEKCSGCTWSSGSPGSCSGWLYAFQKPENQDDFCYEHHDHCWEAEEHLPAPAYRNIFTWRNNSKISFDTANICPDDLLGVSGDSLFDDGNSTSACREIIDWVRGREGWIKARDRDGWTLGDIVYSTPVVVQQPSLAGVPIDLATAPCKTACTSGCDCSSPTNNCRKQCFYCYRECQSTRKRVIYVGANDGMVHAFVAGKWNNVDQEWVTDPAEDSDIGKELWAYLPSNILSKLKELARPTYGIESGCVHRFMVDLSPQAWEVFIDPTGAGIEANRQWRTILIGGERGGGDDYFALDVTYPDNPTVLWEFPALRNMVQMAGPGPYAVQTPYRNKTEYDKVKTLPASWSVPYVGKLKLTEKARSSFLAAAPVSPLDAGTPTLSPSTYGYGDLSGYVAVIPTAPRIFQLADITASATAAQKIATLKPNLLMIDVERGINVFQYLWPLILATQSSKWPDVLNGTNYIPYAPGSAAVLDLWNSSGVFGADGNMDHLYFGDLNGKFYGIKFRVGDNETEGMELDFWQTKDIPSPQDATNVLRSDYEPITIMPSAALDRRYDLHVYFGTGKYDTIKGSNNDKTDTATMSLYSLTDNSTRPTIDATNVVSGTGPVSVSDAANGFKWNNFGVDVNPLHCADPAPTYNTTCTWVTVDGAEDCCESSCDNPCWNCIYSLNAEGERIVDSVLVAGGLVFFTTFVPNSEPCAAGGNAYLYVVDYLCRELTMNPLAGSGFSLQTPFDFQNMQTGEYAQLLDGTKTVGYIARIGVGMPSRPVLDSSSQYLFVQTSVAQIHRIRVQLQERPLYPKGWKEED